MATWGSQTWGFENFGTLGDQNVSVTGISLSSNLGSVTIDSQINTGWGSDTWGFETWGISGQNADVTGIALSASLNSIASITGDAEVTLTGNSLTTNLESVDAFASFIAEPTGIAMTMDITFDPEQVATTGQSMSASLGTATLEANTIAEVSSKSASTWNGNFAWGYGAWGNEQIETLSMSMLEGDLDPAPDASLTGFALSAQLGEEIITADANVSVTGQAMTMTEDSVTIDLNTPVDVTGFDLTMQEGDETATANANVSLTGFNLTMGEGSLNTLIWNQVDTGLDVTWIEVDTAA